MASRGIQVLVVDDEATAVAALAQLLSGEGFEVRAADNGRAALVAIDESTPDVIVTDLTMPEMDGLTLLQELRGRRVEVPVILATVLDVARIQMGGLVVDLGSHRASLLLRDVVTSLEPTATRAGVHLETNIDEDFALCCAFDRIVQVLSNLASNAIHVTEPGRRVRLVAELRGEFARFAIEDQGPGIAPELIPHLFERGFHLDGERHRGTGLGLAIAKGIIEAHAGLIGVESTPGAGTAFYLELPLCGPERISWQVAPPNALPRPGYHRATERG